MHAVDTNVIVRIITADDPVQSPKARRFVERNRIHITTTVLLECEWVLRKTYALARADIAHHLRAMIGLPQVSVETPAQAAQALDWLEQGMDFADALHLAAAMQAGCDGLATFDRKLVAAARKAGIGAVKAL